VTRLMDWIGGENEVEGWLDPWRAQALHSTLDAPAPAPSAGAALPPGWHWCYFLDAVPSAQLGADGHPRRGGFLPPVPLPRRMWAGSRLEFIAPLTLGERARKISKIINVEEKSGRSGQLCFVAVEHCYYGDAGLAIREQQDIVYRDPPSGEAPSPPAAPTDASWRRAASFDSPRLFRYSALTFNSHRIHYDRPYATKEEGYAGLVVHGPLLATLMLELARGANPQRRIETFEFRAIAPIFDGEPTTVCGRPDGDGAELWVADDRGRLHMRGRVTLG
jgi:3-methylfumaryl-CoA hydratase